MSKAEKKRAGVYFMTLTIFFGLVGCSDKQTETESQFQQLPPEPVPIESHSQSSDRSVVKIPSKPADDSIVSQSTYSSPPRKEEAVLSEAVPQSNQIAYLTFDDGPSQSTKKILDILRSFSIPATFFVVGSDSSEGKALYKQIVAEGHALGNHTYSHNYNQIYQSPDAFRKDVRKLDQLLEETVGYRPDILRFPGGSNNHLSWKSGGKGIMSKVAQAMEEDGYQYFDWNVSSTDAAAPVQAKDEIIQAVLGASRGKQNIIVLMHDGDYKTTTVEALPVVIKGLQEAGFRFEKLKKSSFTFQFLKQ